MTKGCKASWQDLSSNNPVSRSTFVTADTIPFSMRTKRLINKIVRCAEDKGWNVNTERNNGMTIFEFSQFTPAGQDFSFSAEMKGNHLDSLITDIEDYYEGFDVDSEAYVWLDESGHGRNGAPYRMRDVLGDMEAAEKMIETLLDAVKTLE